MILENTQNMLHNCREFYYGSLQSKHIRFVSYKSSSLTTITSDPIRSLITDCEIILSDVRNDKSWFPYYDYSSIILSYKSLSYLRYVAFTSIFNRHSFITCVYYTKWKGE